MELLTYISEDRIDLGKLVLVSLSIPCLLKYLLSFFSQSVNLALTRGYHGVNVLAIDVVNVCNTMISVFAYCATEANSDLAVSAVAFNLFAWMLSTGLI